jgi:peptidyl-prolyl cis-trans isomerase SurA
MRNLLFLLSFLTIISSCAVQKQSALENSVLLSIDGDETIADEFIYVYEKNNFNNDSLYYPNDIDEYFDLFVNFKLKVEAAKTAGIDTSEAFLSEFETYKNQLIKPYLSETKEQERLVAEAYERMKYEVDASHILISVEENTPPDDTLAAYNKIRDIYNKARAGEDFGQLAVSFSEDPSAKTNKGRLGYFTAFQMVYAFEDAAYNTPLDSISDILRSRFGYHILKVHNKRPYSGKVKVSHIMLTDKNGTLDENTIKNKIFEIHDQITGGADWNELCKKYSDDQRTKDNGGTLPFIGLRQINDEAFENVAFGLQNSGDISDPVRSRFGWHIIRLEEKQGLQSFEELQEELKQKISKDERSRLSKKAVISNLKNQNHFAQYNANRETLLGIADSSLLSGNWKPVLADSLFQKPVFSIEGNEYEISDFLSNTMDDQRRRTGISPEQYMNELIDNYIEKSLMDYEEKQLINSDRDFRMLLNEYYEGILLFEIMNRNVWGKAVEDTVGLRAFFDENQSKYYWGTRAKATVFRSENKETILAIKQQLDQRPYPLLEITINPGEEIVDHPLLDSLIDLYRKYDLSTITISPIKAAITDSETKKSSDGSGGQNTISGLSTRLLQYFEDLGIQKENIISDVSHEGANNIRVRLNSNSKKSLEYLYNKESALTLQVDEGSFEKGDNQIVDSVSWQKGIREFESDGSYWLVVIDDILDPQPKQLTDIKGTVISDYQNYLEKAWIQELKTTYKVEINHNTFDQIKTAFKKKLHSPG